MIPAMGPPIVGAALQPLCPRPRAENGDAGPARHMAPDGRRPETPFVTACAWHEDVQGPNVTHTICPRCLSLLMNDSETRRPSIT